MQVVKLFKFCERIAEYYEGLVHLDGLRISDIPDIFSKHLDKNGNYGRKSIFWTKINVFPEFFFRIFP